MAASSDESAPTSATSTLGRYRLLAQLGQGGMGAVYLALASGSGNFEKLVVLKELRPDLAQNKRVVSMFLQEAKLAGRLNHANIVQTLEAGHEDGRYFLAMEYLDGQPLSNLIFEKDGPEIPLSLRLQFVCDVLSGLHYAHELQDFDQTPLLIVHCDVSPSNVFVTYDGSVKVIDFGVAKAAGTMPQSKGFQGKVRYAAPEHLRGQVLDHRADVFSAGVLLWEAIARQRFVEGSLSDTEIINRRLIGAERSLSKVMPGVDPALAAICDRALRTEPHERFPTAEQFRSALVDYCSSQAPRMDPSDIARLLRSRYAGVRAQTHMLIRQQLATATGGTAIPHLFPGKPKHDDVTTVADLSTFVRATRDSNPSVPLEEDLEMPKPRSRFVPLYFVGGALLLTGVVAFLSSGKSEEESTSVEANAETIDLDADPGKEGALQEDEATASPSAEAEEEKPSNEREPSADSTEADDERSARSPKSSPRRVRWPAQRSAPAPRAVEPSSSGDATSEQAAEPSSPERVAPSAAEAPAPDPSPSMFGRDLKRRENSDDRRALDADNPFRK